MKYRHNADGSVVCQHRDISCCPACLAADPNLMNVVGAVFEVTPEERAELETILNQED